jgi:hypothetical protein
MAGMSEIKVLNINGLRTRLYLIGFLPCPAETKLQGLITMTNVNQIEDQAVDQRLSRVSQSISDYKCCKHSL